jgi:hypothetical protein
MDVTKGRVLGRLRVSSANGIIGPTSALIPSRPAGESPTLSALAVGLESVLGELLREVVSIL